MTILFIASINSIFSQRIICDSEPINKSFRVENISNKKLSNRSEIIIPVVFHIFQTSDYDFEIDENDIYLQLDVLNKAFSANSYYKSKIPSKFENLYRDSGIRFCLGYRVVDSKIEKGIEYNETNIKNFGDQLLDIDNKRRKIKYNSYGGADGWDSDKYVNVWITEMSALGRSTFPIDDTIDEYKDEAGIIIDYHTLPGRSYLGKTLVHEMGHYFNLLHIWGRNLNDCEDDDGVEDTPEQYAPYYSCPTGDKYSCGSQDMYFNFMDYTDDRCIWMFTAGQIERMRYAIEQYRPTLRNSSNLCNLYQSVNENLKSIKVNISANRSLSVYRVTNLNNIVNIRIFDTTGRLIANSKLLEGEYSKNFNNVFFNSGIFLILFESGNKLYTKKIVIY